MQIEKRLINHYKRWSIEFSYEETFLKFKNRLIRVVDKLIGKYIFSNSNVDKYFLEIFTIHKADEPYVKRSEIVFPGLSLHTTKYLQDNLEYTERGFGDTNVYRYIKNCNTPQEVATVIQFLFWSLEQNHKETQVMVRTYATGTKSG